MANKKEIEVRCSEDIMNGVYANFSIVTKGHDEFMIDFVFLQPDDAHGDIRSRVVIPQSMIRRLIASLSAHLDESDASDDTDEIPPFTINFN